MIKSLKAARSQCSVTHSDFDAYNYEKRGLSGRADKCLLWSLTVLAVISGPFDPSELLASVRSILLAQVRQIFASTAFGMSNATNAVPIGISVLKMAVFVALLSKLVACHRVVLTHVGDAASDYP